MSIGLGDHILEVTVMLRSSENLTIQSHTRVTGRNYCRDQMVADPQTYFQEFISEHLLILLRDSPYLDFISISSNFQGPLFLQDK